MSSCDCSQRLSRLDNTMFQCSRYSWKRMVATQADVPLAMS